MAEKDFTEKILEEYNDVFADIVNVLLFHGKSLVKEDELEKESTRSLYKAGRKLHEQERDVAKYWKNNNIRIALYGLENQTKPDKDMPLRVISYDGAAYKSQLLKDRKTKSESERINQEQKIRYPVITLILYFGSARWTEAKTLYESLNIPDYLKPFVNDYKINLFEIARLKEDQVRLFQSDFQIIADYFVQMKKNRDYQPSTKKMTHVHEVLQLLTALTGDDRFDEVFTEAEKKGEEGGVQTMLDVLDKVEAKGEARGRKIGEDQGKETAILQAICNLMDSLMCTVDQAMELLKIPDKDRSRFARIINAE